MSSKTKILLLKRRECIYTMILVFFAAILVLLMALMFLPGNDTGTAKVSASYTPGIYTASITLNDTPMELEIRVDSSQIRSIEMVHVSDAVTAMYPIVEPALDQIAAQICETQSTENIYYEASRQYTSQMLLQVIRETLEKASA